MHTVNGISENGSVHASQQGCAHGSVRADGQVLHIPRCTASHACSCLPERIAAVKRKTGDKNDGATGTTSDQQSATLCSSLKRADVSVPPKAQYPGCN